MRLKKIIRAIEGCISRTALLRSSCWAKRRRLLDGFLATTPGEAFGVDLVATLQPVQPGLASVKFGVGVLQVYEDQAMLLTHYYCSKSFDNNLCGFHRVYSVTGS